jgi:hypothetical protein
MRGLRMPPELEAAIDAWIDRQPGPKPSRSEAIGRLIERGLGRKLHVICGGASAPTLLRLPIRIAPSLNALSVIVDLLALSIDLLVGKMQLPIGTPIERFRVLPLLSLRGGPALLLLPFSVTTGCHAAHVISDLPALEVDLLVR